MLLDATIVFPNLGIEIEDLPSGFYIGGFYIAWYGVIIAAAMVIAVILAMLRAKKTNQDPDDYVDIGIFSIIFGVIGARVYYVIFSLDQYDSLIDVLNIRKGGLAIYGGLIFGVLAILCVCKYKKISFLRVLDTIAPGIALAQAIGRWGNFFNKEAYGGYTDNLFAMRIKYSEANGTITNEILSNLVNDGSTYIQVHPTFLYESAGCLLIFILIIIFRRWQRYNGEVLLWYVGGYALLRAFVEQLRTDQLTVGDIAVSQLLSVVLCAGAFAVLLINRIRLREWTPDFHLVLEDGEPGTKEYKLARIQAQKDAKAAKKNAGKEAEAKAESEESEDAEAAQAEAEAGEAEETEAQAEAEGEEEATGAEADEAEETEAQAEAGSEEGESAEAAEAQAETGEAEESEEAGEPAEEAGSETSEEGEEEPEDEAGEEEEKTESE